MRRPFSIGTCVLTLATCLLTGGCVAVSGSGNKVMPTRGQQLTDLKTAYDAGAIDQTEYERERDRVMKLSSDGTTSLPCTCTCKCAHCTDG